MIFVTVGHQMPFDRLIRAIDDWSARTGRRDVFAQIGYGKYEPRHFPFKSHLTPDEFRHRIHECSAIVGHAGTGTIIAAMEYRKPLLVLPRLARLGETRNDHQLPTAQHFAHAGHVLAAYDEDELLEKLNLIESFSPKAGVSGGASLELLQRLRSFALGTAEMTPRSQLA